MQFEEQQQHGVLIARPLERRLDAAVIHEFKQHLAGRVEEGHSLIAIDLGEVEFIDSSGLGGVISVLKAVGEGGNVAVFGAGAQVTTLFRLTRMDRIFPMLDSVEQALALLAGAPPGRAAEGL